MEVCTKAQWLERAALAWSLPAIRFSPLDAGFSEKCHVSPLPIIFDVVSLGKALYPHMLHLTQV